MQGFNMGRYHPPASLDSSLSSKPRSGFNKRANGKCTQVNSTPTIRFEMPFAIWCTTCVPENIIGQGVRFNAQKTKVGNYYSTPIWNFSMRHAVCGGAIDIRTDPKAGDYIVFAGGRKRDYGQEDENHTLLGEVVSAEEKKRRAKDPFASLEDKIDGDEKAKKEGWWLEEMQDQRDRDWDDVWRANQKLRRTFRVQRKELQRQEEEREEVAERLGLAVHVLDATAEDGQRARLVTFGASDDSNDWGTSQMAAAAVTAKPLFHSRLAKTTEDIYISESTENSESLGKTKAQLKNEKARALLQQNLQGNTRALNDPFIVSRSNSSNNSSTSTFLAGVKRKRNQGLIQQVENRRQQDRSDHQSLASSNIDTTAKAFKPALLVSYNSDGE